MHRGTIKAYSEGKGKGAKFEIRIPLADSESGLETPAESVSPIPKPIHPLRILLVEDHGDTANIMKRLLEADGHSVEMAGDVAMAMALASKLPFDLLLSDLGLPDGSGMDLMRALRAKGMVITAIALSGYGHKEDIRLSKDAGFAAHLVKPISLKRLRDVIARTVGRGERVEVAVLLRSVALSVRPGRGSDRRLANRREFAVIQHTHRLADRPFDRLRLDKLDLHANAGDRMDFVVDSAASVPASAASCPRNSAG